MDRKEALSVLGVSSAASSLEIREAHRRCIRESHPDLGGSAREAARVNEALEVARCSVEAVAPRSPAAPQPAAAPAPPEDVDQFFVVDEHPAALLARLAEAGHSIGEVVFVDPHVGLLEIVVGTAPAVGQLAVTVGEEGPAGTPVSFTLDALGVTPAPSIESVVGALMAAISG